MQRLYHFLSRNPSYLALGVAILLSLVLMALGSSDQVALARGVTTGLLKVGHVVFAWPMDISELRQQTLKEGLRPLRLSGASKVANGLTTIEEVMRVAPPPLAQ